MESTPTGFLGYAEPVPSARSWVALKPIPYADTVKNPPFTFTFLAQISISPTQKCRHACFFSFFQVDDAHEHALSFGAIAVKFDQDVGDVMVITV